MTKELFGLIVIVVFALACWISSKKAVSEDISYETTLGLGCLSVICGVFALVVTIIEIIYFVLRLPSAF